MAYKGVESIFVPSAPTGQTPDGDPIYDDGHGQREIKNCQPIPRTLNDDNYTIVDGWYVFVPPGELPPVPTDTVIIRGVEYEIDGNVAKYDKKGVPKGAFFNAGKVL